MPEQPPFTGLSAAVQETPHLTRDPTRDPAGTFER